jgi:ATP-binding cassette subfamily B protein
MAAGAGVMGLGAAPALHLVLLAAWLTATAWLIICAARRLAEWAEGRLGLTEDLVENMVGHRTLVAQLPPERRHRGDDRALAAYERRAAALDAAMAQLASLAPRGWLALGILGLGPAFAAGAASAAQAVSLGGVLLVYLGLRRLADAAPALCTAVVAWRRTRPIFAAAARGAAAPPAPLVAQAPDEQAAGRRGLLVARDVSFHYPGRAEPVLREASFELGRGARVLVDGPSGAGKSTLVALLAGLRQPSSGVLLLSGFDHHSLRPERWRQRSAGVPQTHENHLLSATLLFNLLMGRRWPPRAEDVAEAEAVCCALGLGPLLERMPAGLQQMVGDSGWQLSHGESSRVFVARSLLQSLDVRVLDESFASLDPDTAATVLDAVLARSETLVVVRHG